MRFSTRPDARPMPPPEADSLSGQPAWQVKRILGKKLLRQRVRQILCEVRAKLRTALEGEDGT